MSRSIRDWKPAIIGRVFDSVGKGPVRLAEVTLLVYDEPGPEVRDGGREPKEKRGSKAPRVADRTLTRDDGQFEFVKDLEEGKTYQVRASAFGKTHEVDVTVERGCEACASLPLDLTLAISVLTCAYDGKAAEPCGLARVGRSVIVRQEWNQIESTRWNVSRGAALIALPEREAQISFTRAGKINVDAWARDKHRNSLGEFAEAFIQNEIGVAEPEVDMIGGRVGVALERTAVPPTLDQALWVAIRNRTRAISFRSL